MATLKSPVGGTPHHPRGWETPVGCVSDPYSSGGVPGSGASRTFPLEQHKVSASSGHRWALQNSQMEDGLPTSCASAVDGNASSTEHL